MKTQLLIIIGIVIILTGSLTVLFSQQTEIECLRLYKDIRELSRTPEMSLADQQTVDAHKNAVFEYVGNYCIVHNIIRRKYQSQFCVAEQ